MGKRMVRTKDQPDSFIVIKKTGKKSNELYCEGDFTIEQALMGCASIIQAIMRGDYSDGCYLAEAPEGFETRADFYLSVLRQQLEAATASEDKVEAKKK